MKKLSLTIVLLVVFILNASSASINFTNLIGDLTIFFVELGKEMLPHMIQNELSGYGMGAADLNNDKTFFSSWSLGATLSYGLFKFIDEDNKQFNMLNMYEFVDTLITAEDIPGFVQDGYQMAQDFYPYPNIRLSTGFNFIYDTEIILLFSIFPGIITESIAGLTDAIKGIEWNNLNLGLRIRKVLLKDSSGFPAISLGVGYTFANFHLGFAMTDSFTQELGEDTLEFVGNLYMDTWLHTAGVDLTVSKELSFFVPFIKTIVYYQWSDFSGGMEDFSAVIKDSDENVSGSTTTGPAANVELSELSILLNAGFELRFGNYILIPYSTFDIYTNSFAVNLEMRLNF